MNVLGWPCAVGKDSCNMIFFFGFRSLIRWSQYIWVAVKISPFSILPIAIPGLSSLNLWFSERVVEAKVPLQKLCNIAFTLCLFRQWKLFNVFTLGSRNTYHCHPSACVKSHTVFSIALGSRDSCMDFLCSSIHCLWPKAWNQVDVKLSRNDGKVYIKLSKISN